MPAAGVRGIGTAENALADCFEDLRFGHVLGDLSLIRKAIEFAAHFVIHVDGKRLDAVARDEYFRAKLRALFGGQRFVARGPAEQSVGDRAADGEQRGVQHDETEPVAEPYLPAVHRFREYKMDASVLDLEGDGGTSGPEGGEGKDQRGGPEAVSQENLHMALQCAVAFHAEGDADDGKHQHGKEYNDNARAHRVADGDSGNG